MAEPSNQNPERNMSFSLNPTNIIKLKKSIKALCDSEFNRKGEGMLEVTEMGFEFTVRNTNTGTLGNIFLKSSGLINFYCNNRILRKKIFLYPIYETLNDASDDDTVTVFHRPRSNHLSFIFESAPDEELLAEFLGSNARFEKLPNIQVSCETSLKSEILREMVQRLHEKGFLLVSLDILPTLVTVVIGQICDPWVYKINEDDENFKVRIMTEETHHHAWLEVKHLEAMRKASEVVPEFQIQFLNEPSGNIMTRFSLEELGDLVFVHKAMLITNNPRKYQIGIIGDIDTNVRDAEIQRLVDSMFVDDE